MAALGVAFGLVAACSSDPVRQAPGGDAEVACVAELLALEEQAAARGITPSEPRRMDAFPELASNRVLAGFDPVELTSTGREDWLARLAEAGSRRRALLLSALAAQADAAGDTAPREPVSQAAFRAYLDGCAGKLTAARAVAGNDWTALAAAAQVPDDYRSLQRVLGLYPLAALPVRRGIEALHREVAETFATPLEALPVRGALQRWSATPTPPEVPLAVPPHARDSLGVLPARIDAGRLEALFTRHAPVLEIDVAGTFDAPGAVRFGASGHPAVDTHRPVAYRYARVMPLGGELRLQLVYVYWFAARPKRGVFDSLGGAIDGLVWRVTLDHDGEVLLYDSIHPCGCYHHFFPGARLAPRPEVAAWAEPPLLPQSAPVPGPGEGVVLRIASATHFLQRVYADSLAGQRAASYDLVAYDTLYAVPAPGGARSFFARDGLVPGTQRGERLYLWPMGVPSAGAMRERGRQATAFLGRRHFDDATLLDALFDLAPRP